MNVVSSAVAPLVDCHAHIFTRDLPLSGTAWRHPEGEATLDDYLRALDSTGVTYGVLAAAAMNDIGNAPAEFT